jgi:hypothetical protein
MRARRSVYGLPAQRETAMKQVCDHVKEIREVTPSGPGCKECVEMGDTWVELRLCLTCGHVGCRDSSKNTHATKHFRGRTTDATSAPAAPAARHHGHRSAGRVRAFGADGALGCILRQLARAGRGMRRSGRWSCPTGMCHRCESGLVDGTVAYLPEPLDAPADGNVLACCSTPSSDVVIDLWPPAAHTPGVQQPAPGPTPHRSQRMAAAAA